MKKTFLALALSLSAATASAEEAEKTLSTDIELGFISTSGNTETTSLQGRLNVKQELEKFRNSFIAEALYAEDEVTIEADGETRTETQTTAERYFLSAQSDFKLNKEHKGIFVFGSYEQDEFSNFEYQATVAIGYSDRIFSKETTYLSYSLGPGMAFNEVQETGETNELGVLRAAAEYFVQISENAKFTQTLSSEIPFDSDDNRKTKAESALTANITSGLALKVSFVVDHNSEVSEGVEKTDTRSAVTLVYSF